MSDIFTPREVYKPFEYSEFESIHTKLMSSFWHPHEITLDKDLQDFKKTISKSEREIVTRILRNFVQSEIHVGCFWNDVVATNLQKPEIMNVARYISGNETIHAFAYDYLNASLGLEEYHLLMDDLKLNARVENLKQPKPVSKAELLHQIAHYSVFGEGVALFSSFIILFSFTKKNLFKNLGQIISWSTLDEQLHAECGVKLVNIIRKENPDLWNDEAKSNIYKACTKVVEIEMELIDRVFENTNTDVISKEAVQNFVKHKANQQLKKIGLKKQFKVDKELLKETDFFDIMVNGESVHDFFQSKENSYSRGSIVIDNSVWEK